MNLKNMQTRLLIMLMPLIFLIVGVLSGVSYYLSEHILSRSVEQTARAVGTDYSKRVEGEVGKLITELADLADIQRIRTGKDKEEIVGALMEYQKRVGIFDSLIFISPDGIGVTSRNTTNTYSERDYFKNVIGTKKAFVSNPAVSKSTGKLSVMMAVPVLYNGETTGVLVGTIGVDSLTTMIKDLTFLDTGYGQLSDQTGLVFADPKHPDLVGKLNLSEKHINPELKLTQSELDDRLVNLYKENRELDKQVQGEFVYFDGNPTVAVVTPIVLPGGVHWSMSVLAPKGEATAEISILARTMFIACVIGLLVAAAIIVLVARKVVKPITMIRNECQLLTQGDLRVRSIGVSSEDEIGQLAKGFQELRITLHDLVGKVRSQSEQLAASSQQMTASAEQSSQAATLVATAITEVAKGAEQQVDAINRTAAVVEQVSAGIQLVATNTNHVAWKSTQATETATEGGRAVDNAVRQMTKIEETVNNSAQVVANLGERSKEIGQIVDTIAGIAGQTNLLALNAAIEAARAGELGRGFAVVADEVRKLAEQSHSAAKQIGELISEIQGETEKAVAAMGEGTQEVKVGTDVVTTAGYAFGAITDLVREVSSQMKEISVATGQMASSSQEIVSSVQEIKSLGKNAAGEAQSVSAATEEQSASVEEIAVASQSLAKLAESLMNSVSKFQV